MMGWVNAWNFIIRKVIWKDSDLKTLMKLPEKTNIIQFVERYFIRAGFTNKLLTDEPCRIVYSDTQGYETEVPNIKKNLMIFDIYVKESELRNIGDDRLVTRLDLLSECLYRLLTKDRYVAETGYRFWIAGDWDGGTRVTGYYRKTIAFYYMKVY